jgi:hypothetical protein
MRLYRLQQSIRKRGQFYDVRVAAVMETGMEGSIALERTCDSPKAAELTSPAPRPRRRRSQGHWRSHRFRI